MAVKEINRKYLFLGSLLFVLLALLLRFGDLAGRFNINIGFAALNRAMTTKDFVRHLDNAVTAEPFFAEAMVHDRDNLSAERGLGLSSGLQNNVNKALPAFNILGVQAAENYTLVGDAAERLGNHERAVFWYEQAVELDPNQYAAWIKLGDTYKKTGAANKSVAAYAEAWAIAPSVAFEPYVSALITEGEPAKAEGILQVTLNRDLEFHERLWGWHTLGQILKDRGDWDAAYEAYSAGLKEYERDASLLVSLGWLLYEKDPDAAVEHFEAAISENADSGVGYFAMGQLMVKEKNYVVAEDWYKLALERNDSNPRWRLLRGNTARQSGNYDLAVKAYLDTINRFPSFAPAYYELAKTYKLQNSPEQALQILDQASTRSVQTPIRYYLSAAEIYLWGGQPNKAIHAYQDLLDLDPDNSEALEQLQRLQNN